METTIRPIKLQDNELEELRMYARELGYVMEQSGGIWMLKDPITQKRVFLQRDHQKLIAVSDEAIVVNKNMDIEVIEFVEDMDTNLSLFKAISTTNEHVRNGVTLLFSKLSHASSKHLLREVVGIVGLDFLKIK